MNDERPGRSQRYIMTCLTAVGCLLVCVSSTKILPIKVIWNVSLSVPTGFYSVGDGPPLRGDLVLVRLPEHVRDMASRRGYLPANIPALKRISALRGDTVCRFGRVVFVNGKVVAKARLMDGSALKMPLWRGCTKLNESQAFLLADHPNSFDGRYFGVTDLADVLGVATPL